MQDIIIPNEKNEVILNESIDLIKLLLNDKRSVHTKRAYYNDIIQFFYYVTGNDLTKEHVHHFLSLSRTEALELVLTYKSYLITERRQAESTINRKIASIRSLVRLAKTLGYCTFDLKEVKFERVKTYRDTSGITLEQFKSMLKVPDQTTLKGMRDTAILLLLFETALRRGELTNIMISDYIPESRLLWILGKGRGTQKESITISSGLVQMIETYLHRRKDMGILTNDSALFVTTDRRTYGAKMTGEAIRRIVRDCAYHAGIKRPISPHKIRHSAITIALDQTNGDVRAVQKLSRHKKIETLLIYDDNRQNQQGVITELLSSLF